MFAEHMRPADNVVSINPKSTTAPAPPPSQGHGTSEPHRHRVHRANVDVFAHSLTIT
jgi:hypothetical protein